MAKGDMQGDRAQRGGAPEQNPNGPQAGGHMPRGMFGFNQSGFGAGLGNMMSGIAGRGMPFRAGGFNPPGQTPTPEQGGITPNFGGPLFRTGGMQFPPSGEPQFKLQPYNSQSAGFAGGGFQPDTSSQFGGAGVPDFRSRLGQMTGGNTGISGGMDFGRLFGGGGLRMF